VALDEDHGDGGELMTTLFRLYLIGCLALAEFGMIAEVMK
jgi:hypothetical protein